MRWLLLFLTAICSISAQEWSAGNYQTNPNPVESIIAALKASNDDALTPHLSEQDGKKFSYHLASARYLGSISRKEESFQVAAVLFIRSSPEGQEHPPARSHGFLILINTKGELASICGVYFPDQVELIDSQLKRGSEIIGDLSSADIPTRSRGFLIDGGDFLPYPFADRIAEKAESTDQAK